MEATASPAAPWRPRRRRPIHGGHGVAGRSITPFKDASRIEACAQAMTEQRGPTVPHIEAMARVPRMEAGPSQARRLLLAPPGDACHASHWSPRYGKHRRGISTGVSPRRRHRASLNATRPRSRNLAALLRQWSSPTHTPQPMKAVTRRLEPR
jgi:hypothetical protein